MNTFPNIHDKNPEGIEKSIYIIERRDLDVISEIEPRTYEGPVWTAADFRFVRINAISKAIPLKKSEVERYLMEDIISGLYGSKLPFIYLIIGLKTEINVYLGILTTGSIHKLESFTTSLYSTFPNIEISVLNDSKVENDIYQFLKRCKHFGVMTGIPTPKIGVEEYGIEQIERLLRGCFC